MSYCHATTANARYLSSKTGLNVFVALAWLWNECQTVNNPTNPLNIRYYGTHGQIGKIGGFGTYQSTQAGLDNAAWLIKNGASYSGIRAAIASGNMFAQARAIELSPWAGGHYGGATKPGNISKKLSAITGKPIEAVAQANETATGNTTPQDVKDTATGASDQLAGFGYLVSFPVGHVLTTADVQQIMDATTKAGWWSDPIGGQTAKEIMQGILQQEVGKPWNKDLQNEIQSKVNMAAGLSGQIGPNAIAAVAGAVPDIPGAIGSFGGIVIKVVTYSIAVVFILAGLWLYSKGRMPSLYQEGITVRPTGAPSGED